MRMAFAVAVAVFLLAPGARGQTCEEALGAAQKSFELGLFEDVPAQLSPCTGARISRPLAIQVRSLLARVYLELEEVEKARAEVETLLRLDSTFEPGSSPRLAALVADVRRETVTTQVASVSKTAESLREAPATVMVITGEEIQRRGYLDLEQLLHDLPGFEISRMNGAFYSIIYQRGYVSALNDRNLLLVDGIEQNDLAFGIVYLSRQYPLTNIDRVEVIYGPTSTMYGANAYTGVISILTKAPEAIVGEGGSFGVRGQVTGGGYGGGSLDLTAAGRDRSSTIAWSVAANVQHSTERDLSGFGQWDHTFSSTDYSARHDLPGSPLERELLCTQPTQVYVCDESGIHLTPEGVDVMRALDLDAVHQHRLEFGDTAKNWSLNAILRLADLTLGLQSWRSQEGTTTGTHSMGATSWTPSFNAAYLKYSLPVRGVKLNIFTRYVQTVQEKNDSRINLVHGFFNSFLSLYNLAPPCDRPFDPEAEQCAPGTYPWVEEIRFGNTSSQFKSEINGVWEPSRMLSAVAGLEIAKSSVQGGYDQTGTGDGPVVNPEAPQQRGHSDYAVYAQAAWKPRPSLKLTAAGRFTYNEIENRDGESGFGGLFTPRAAIIYSPARRHLVLKAIYSEAFKDPTDAQKFGVQFSFFNAYRSNGLRPERVRNIELSAGWEPSEHFSVEASMYQARYTDVVNYGVARQPDGSLYLGCSESIEGCEQWQNRDSIRIRGGQLMARFKHRLGEVWGNYTYTDPQQTNPTGFFREGPIYDQWGNTVRNLRLHGVATGRVNLGIDAHLRDRLQAGIRAHYVGTREMGNGTTLSRFALNDIAATEPANMTVDATISYRVRAGTTLQLSSFNVFDAQYYDPGTDPTTRNRILQAGRAIHLRLIYALPFRK